MTNSSNKPIDYFDRDIFAEEIFEKIFTEHGQNSTSFIFGISGDWGEGKTHLLELLERRLKADNFQVIWFSPWKFASDKVSLMRRFIRLINNILPAHHLLKIKRRENLDDFERDQRILKVNYRNLGFAALVLAVTFWFYRSKPEPFWNLALELKVVLIAVVVPLVVAVLARIATLQTTAKAVSAIDQFDDRLRIVLDRLTKSNKKIVVFVDDLDRVTAEEAKQVLDALRTFFDKPELTYVVTGDHRTLEGFMGQEFSETQPGQEQDTEKRNEEGRRFLKKIFNVYWKMPLPTETQMKTFIDRRLTNSKLSGEEKDKLTSWLIRFFDLNARNTERFIEMVDFSISSLERRKATLEAKAESEQSNLDQITEVLANKLLLVRTLMFQEKAYPLYEKLAISPDLLKQIEERVDKNEEYSEILTNLNVRLGEEQVRFLAEFLPEKPRFYMNGGLQHRLFPFFRLAGEVGLSDNRGVTLEAFEGFIRNGQHDLISSWLKLTPDVDALTTKAKEIIDTEPDINIKKGFVTTIINSIKDKQDVAAKFLIVLAPSIDSVVKGIDSDERMTMLREIMELTDQLDQPTAAQIHSHFTFSSSDDFDRIGDTIGANSAICYANWFITYLDQDIWGALIRFASLKGRIVTDETRPILSSKENAVVEAFFAANDDQRLQIMDFLNELPNGLPAFRAVVLDRIDTLDVGEQTRIVTFIKGRYGLWVWGIKRVKKWLADGH
ncbi:MAG: P-loop NTPase fold protein [Candidatus Paceibacterota bacterium]